MKPGAFAVSSVLLILAIYINAFIVYHLFGGHDFLDFAGTIFAAPLAAIVAGCAFSVISYGTGRKPLSAHPILSGVALLNMAFPMARLFLFFSQP
jgi:hypothetical protein